LTISVTWEEPNFDEMLDIGKGLRVQRRIETLVL